MQGNTNGKSKKPPKAVQKQTCIEELAVKRKGHGKKNDPGQNHATGDTLSRTGIRVASSSPQAPLSVRPWGWAQAQTLTPPLLHDLGPAGGGGGPWGEVGASWAGVASTLTYLKMIPLLR